MTDRGTSAQSRRPSFIKPLDLASLIDRLVNAKSLGNYVKITKVQRDMAVAQLRLTSAEAGEGAGS